MADVPPKEKGSCPKMQTSIEHLSWSPSIEVFIPDPSILDISVDQIKPILKILRLEKEFEESFNSPDESS